MPEQHSNQTILIVGNGQAAAMAVQQLRSQAFDGCIKVVGQEPYPAYERPPLSKAMLAEPGADVSSICIHSPDFRCIKHLHSFPGFLQRREDRSHFGEESKQD